MKTRKGTKPKSSGESEAFLTFPSQRHKPFIKRKGIKPFPILYFNIKIKKGNQKDFVFVFAFVFRSIRRFGLQEELIIILNIFCLQSSINLFQSERFVFILTIFLRSMETSKWLKHTQTPNYHKTQAFFLPETARDEYSYTSYFSEQYSISAIRQTDIDGSLCSNWKWQT